MDFLSNRYIGLIHILSVVNVFKKFIYHRNNYVRNKKTFIHQF
jgi:hypothetical protein